MGNIYTCQYRSKSKNYEPSFQELLHQLQEASNTISRSAEMMHVELQKIIVQSPQSVMANTHEPNSNFNTTTPITTEPLYQNSAVSDVATINVTDSTLLGEHTP